MKAICAGKNRLQFYSDLNLIAKRFFASDFEDVDLNRELLELLSQKFDLCTEFKRIYVYGLGITDQDRQAIIREVDLMSPPLGPAPLAQLGQRAGPHRKMLSTGSVPAQFLNGLGGVPLERTLSEQSNDSSCLRMTKMSLDDMAHEDEVLHYRSPEQIRHSGEAEDEQAHDEQSVDGDQEEEHLNAGDVNYLQHSLNRSQPASGQQSLAQSLRGSFTGNRFADENETDWVCLGQSEMMAGTHHTDGMGVGGVGMGEDGICD